MLTMSVSLEKSSSLASRFRDALPSIVTKSRHGEIWGIDLEHAEWEVVEVILEKFLKSHSAIPALQLPRAIASLEKTLRGRRFSHSRDLIPEVESLLPDLDVCHITLIEGQYVLWVNVDEMAIKGCSAIHQGLTTSQDLLHLGVAVMEKLSSVLLHAAVNSDSHDDCPASCVVEFKIHRPIQNNKKKGEDSFQKRLCHGLEQLMTLIRHHYPRILGKAYIINPREEYLASLDVDETLLRNTTILEKPEDLAQHLGSQVPPRYGGTGKSFVESDFLHKGSEGATTLETPETSDAAAVSSETEAKTEAKKETAAPPSTEVQVEESVETEEQPKLRLLYSETIGPPSIILDPEDLDKAEDICPDKMGARVCFADSDMVVKFGHGVGLGEAEAMHLVATRTTITIPKLLSAYILDGIGYIVMSYEPGEPLHRYWDRVSSEEQNRVLEKLRDYVNQMREIPGDFIGPLDRSPCRDGIFEAGYGDYTKYSYGPYENEESLNEGIIQALRDRFPPKVFEERREEDMESHFYNGEYMLYQTVREMRNHKIVFTHADLHPGNIVVRTDGTVVLLDWGLAGFWPEYWEFYRAMNSIPWRGSWDRMVEKFVPPFYIEYSVMKRVFGTVWN